MNSLAWGRRASWVLPLELCYMHTCFCIVVAHTVDPSSSCHVINSFCTYVAGEALHDPSQQLPVRCCDVSPVQSNYDAQVLLYIAETVRKFDGNADNGSA